MARDAGSDTAIDWVARARGLAPLVAAAADRIEAERRIPADVLDAIHDAQLFRLLLPRSIGGAETDPLTAMAVMEIIAAADASTAWCLGQGLGCSLAAAYLDPAAAHEIFDDPRGVIAWGPPSGAKAIAVEGGYRVTGRWRFASGAPNATWFGGHSVVCDADGTPRKGPAGRPVLRTMLFPVGKAQVIDTWNVIGLRGTGSNDYAVDDLFVPESHTTWRDSKPDRREHGPLYNIPLLTFYGMMFAPLAMGIAGAALDAFMELARTKVGSGFSTPLCDNAVVQSDVAVCHGRLLSSRLFLKERIGAIWDAAQADAPFPLAERAKLRIAITYGMSQACKVVETVYRAAGTNAIFADGAFERRYRDINTLTQQGQAHRANFQFAGQALFGTEPGQRL